MQQMNFPEKRYDVIVIDPPWQMSKIKTRHRPYQIDMDYNVMGIEDITKLPIGNIAKDDSWCFLWATQKYLFIARDILESWGFKYLILMTWKKTFGISEGMNLFGFVWNSEFVLVGHKGNLKAWNKHQKLIKTSFEAENKKHSEKPNEFYRMIEHLGKDRIDLFARSRRNGWDVWGNECNNDISLKELKQKVEEL